MGTPEFAVPSLRVLIESADDVIAVVAQPDKPKGRGRKLTPPPTKVLAEEYNIPVLQPERIRAEEFLEELKELNPDLICVTAYGKILPKDLLELPQYGCINVHASLLPKYRGAAPINWAVVRGEGETGVTTILMDEGMDTGDMLLRRGIQIQDEDDAGSLFAKLSDLGGELLLETIAQLKERGLNPIKQDESQASYAPMLKKSDGEINWEKSALEIWNLIRGMNPWPGTFTRLGNKSLKIFSSGVVNYRGKPAEVLESVSGTLIVACGEGALEILELQLEGGKRLDVKAFLSGRKIDKGAILGS